MANRNWASGGKIYSMHANPCLLNVTAQIGAAGAVSSIVGSAIQSVEHVSTGIYKIKAQPKTDFSRMYFASGSCQSPASGLSGIMQIEIQNDPNSSVSVSDGAELTVKCLDVSGVLADPADGSALNVMMLCSNSSVLIDGE